MPYSAGILVCPFSLITGLIFIILRHESELGLQLTSEPAPAEEPSKDINRSRNETGNAEGIYHIRRAGSDTPRIPAELRHRAKKEAVGQ